MWLRTTSGKRMPLNVAPDVTGNIEIRDGIAHYVTPDANATELRYTSHFVNCPDAAKHRKKRTRK